MCVSAPFVYYTQVDRESERESRALWYLSLLNNFQTQSTAMDSFYIEKIRTRDRKKERESKREKERLNERKKNRNKI